MASRTRRREEFSAILTAELHGRPEEALNLARFLLRSSTTFQRLNELDANGRLTPEEMARGERLSLRVQEACAVHGIGVRFGSDPRGAAIKLELPSGRSNDAAGEGWVVP